MSNELTSALDTISKIGRTTNEFARRGFERITRLPLLAEHRDNIAAHAAVQSNTAITPSYTPYARFTPRYTSRGPDASSTPTDENQRVTQNSSSPFDDRDDLYADSSEDNSSPPPSSNGGEKDTGLIQGDSSHTSDGNITTSILSNPFIRPNLQRSPSRTRDRRAFSHRPSPQASLRRTSSLAGQPPSCTAGGDSTDPPPLSACPPSSPNAASSQSDILYVPTEHHVPLVGSGPIVSPRSPSPVTRMVEDPLHIVHPVDHPPHEAPLAVVPTGPPSPAQMDAYSGHLALPPVDPPSHLSPNVPLEVVSAESPPPIQMDANTDHPVISPAGCPSHHPLVPSTEARMDIDRELHVSHSRMDVDPDIHPTQSGSRNSSVTPHVPSPSQRSPSMSEPTRPTRPLVLPTVLDDIITRVVSERLDATAASLVGPTVQGIVDACIPRLTEFIDSRFTTLTSGLPQRNHANSQPGVTDEEQNGDDESEEVLLNASPRRKKPGPRGKTNRLHLAFRKYLRSKNVILQMPKGALPPLAPQDTVQSFNRDGASPPMLENIALDWLCNPLKSSRWNCEVIALLSADFCNSLKNGTYQDVVYNEATMSLPSILKLCEQKLIRTQQAYRKQIKIEATTATERDQVTANFTVKEERRRKAERMTSRRHGTLARRTRIILQNRSRDPKVWDAIHKIVARLDVEGMSGDETDSPSGVNPKTLRRLELPWINLAVTQLFKAVESYESAARQESMSEQIGNSSLERRWEAARKDVKSRPVAGLPRNWYDDTWFQGLTTGARSMLAPGSDVAIPTLNPFGG